MESTKKIILTPRLILAWKTKTIINTEGINIVMELVITSPMLSKKTYN